MKGKIEMAEELGATRADSVGVKLRTEILPLSPSQIDPDPQQPRQEFDKEGLARLADSLREFGQLQPVLVRRAQNRYVLVAGERRWRAAKIAGIESIHALVCRGDPRSIQLIENLLREDLKPVEQAKAFAAIMRRERWSARELARQLALEHSGVSRALALLKLEPEIQEAVDEGKIPKTSAYEIAKKPRSERLPLAAKVIAGEIKGDDLRQRPATPDRPVLTLGMPDRPAPWEHIIKKITVVVSGHRSRNEIIPALESALDAARIESGNLVGGLGVH